MAVDVTVTDDGGSFEISVEWDDDGYDGHYANVHVDWDQNERTAAMSRSDGVVRRTTPAIGFPM